MKKIVITLFLCIILCSCDVSTRGVTDNAKHSGSVSASAVTASAVVPSGVAVVVSASAVVPSGSAAVVGKNKPIIVTDMTGQTRELKMENVDVKKKDTPFPPMLFPANYSQVINNHYYFLRADGKRNYTIYRDNAEEVGKFSLKKGIVEDFILYRDKFYAVVAKNYAAHRYKKLVEIDLERRSVVDVCYVDLKKGVRKDIEAGMMYKGAYYYYHSKNFEIGAYDLSKRKIITPSFAKAPSFSDALAYGSYWDDKVYYGVVLGKKIVIYSFDLKSCAEKEVLQFEYTDNPKIEGIKYIYSLDIDTEYIYCLNYLIPRNGGEIIELPRFEIDTVAESFTFNTKYIFYIDKEQGIHRFDKKTLKDVIISNPDTNNIWAMNIWCTEDGLYIQNYLSYISMDYIFDEADHCDFFGRDTEYPVSCDIYYMDVNGKNIKRIWEGREYE